MKKKLWISFCLMAGILCNVYTQEVSKQLNEAHAAYGSGKLQDARFALQQALNEIDMVIGAEILKMLPAEMAGMPKNTQEDNVTTVGIMGLFVTRYYRAPEGEDHVSIQIISDSPLLSGYNALLAMPVFFGDANQKRIRVGSRRALLQKNEDEQGNLSWDVQLPLGNTLLSFSCKGPGDENTVTELVNSIPVDEIERLVR